MHGSRETVAVVGSGVAGLTAAHVLARSTDVVLLEADERFGGHAHTHDVLDSSGRTVAVDSGFIVHNQRTYPTLLRLFAELEVPTQESDMSMSVHCDGCGLEYAGARGTRGLFAAPQAANPRYLRMLAEVKKFHRQAHRVLASDQLDQLTLGGFLELGGYSQYFVRHFMVPFVSAVWSAGPQTSLGYPAKYLFRFFAHHGYLSVGGSPQWRTVTGGSRSYVDALTKALPATRLNTPARAITRHADGVTVLDEDGASTEFDRVVVATHADDALALLTDPTPDEQAVLGAFGYASNETVLHTDTSLLPRHAGAAASWNYRLPTCAAGETGQQTVLSYDMNRLQRLDAADHFVVTLNQTATIDPSTVRARMRYTHPVYTLDSVAAQSRLPELQAAGNPDRLRRRLPRLGLPRGRSAGRPEGSARAGRLLVSTPTRTPTRAGTDTGPWLYDAVVGHARRAPLHHGFSYAVRPWLVDLDTLDSRGIPQALPRALAPLARFQGADHFDGVEPTLRGAVDAWCARHDRERPHRVLTLTQPRTLGYVFNPISVHWLHAADGTVDLVLAEVHNTYAGRHVYEVHRGTDNQAQVDKAFPVSPVLHHRGELRDDDQRPRRARRGRHHPGPPRRCDRPGDREPRARRRPRPRHPTVHRHAARRARARHPRRRPHDAAAPPVADRAHQRPDPQARHRAVAPRQAHPRRRRADTARARSSPAFHLGGSPMTTQDHTRQREVATPRPAPTPRHHEIPLPAEGHWPGLATPPHHPVRRMAAAKLFLHAADELELLVSFPDGTTRGSGRTGAPVMRLIRPDAFFERVGRSGLIGFGEAFMAGDWDSDELTEVLAPLAARMANLIPVPLQRLRRLVDRGTPAAERNDIDGARDNIHRHYDLSNDLFQLFLDETMSYSAALFADPASPDAAGESLLTAQERKMDSVLDLARVGTGSHVLEIGSGWGGLAIRAAERGARVLTVTLSAEQKALADERIAAAGLTDRIEVRLSDYREVRGSSTRS